MDERGRERARARLRELRSGEKGGQDTHSAVKIYNNANAGGPIAVSEREEGFRAAASPVPVEQVGAQNPHPCDRLLKIRKISMGSVVRGYFFLHFFHATPWLPSCARQAQALRERRRHGACSLHLRARHGTRSRCHDCAARPSGLDLWPQPRSARGSASGACALPHVGAAPPECQHLNAFLATLAGVLVGGRADQAGQGAPTADSYTPPTVPLGLTPAPA